MKNRLHSRLQSILPSIKACFSMPALLVSAALSWSLSANAATETFNTAGTFNWVCPAGVTTISVAVQGGGGGGGGSTASNNRMGAGGGGGGCAYSPALTVVPGTVYTVTVGAGGTAGPNTSGTGGTGGASSFSDGVLITLTANGGGGGGLGSTGTGGAGGTATGGTVNFSGGNGANGAAATPPISAGAGGGGAGTDANGSPGSGATGGAGGTGSPAGGKGANSPTGEAVGIAGAAPGGGGSGGCKATVGSRNGGAGGRGQVTLTYTDPPAPFKGNNTDNLNLASSWTGGYVPNAGNTPAEWNNTVTGANTVSLGGDLTFSGIKISDPGGPVTINAGNTLTLGAAAVDLDLSTATQDLTLNADLVMGAANVWDVASGRTATLGGAVSGSASVTKQGAGTAVLAGSSTYSGTTTVSGGSLNVSGSLVNASLGSIAVQAGGTLNASGTVTGGTSTALTYGTTAGTSTVNISSGANLTLGALAGSNNASAVSVYTQTGGTVNLNAAASTTDSSYVAQLGYGHLNLTGGSIAASSRFSVTFSQSGPVGVARIGGGVGAASLSANDLIAIGRTGSSTGEMTVLSNGAVTYNGTGANNMLLLGNAANPTGLLNIVGGTFSSPVKGISWGNGTSTNGGLGMVNLSAGTLEIGTNVVLNTIASGNNRGYVNLSGGTLKVMSSAISTGLLPSSSGGFGGTGGLANTIFGTVTNSTVNHDGSGGASGVSGSVGTTQDFAGGVTIHTNGFNSTFTSQLLAPTGNGVAQGNLGITGGSGYVAPPSVRFSAPAAGNSTPAAGYALVSGGQVTGIVITCPGDYAIGETPTVTLNGGGGTGASVTVTGPLTANTSGGLTKSGAGTLTLAGANTYTGATVVSGGQLVLSGSGTLAAGSGLSVGGGAAFRYLPTTIGSTLATGSLNLADGSLLGLAWDATTANQIAATGAASVGAGIGVALDMGTGFNPGTSYTILTAASGLDVGKYTFINLTDFTMGVVKTPTSVSVTPTSTTPLTGAYWRGTASAGLTKIWAATDGGTDSNWSATAGGATQGLVPGASADVFIPNTAPVVPATSTVLGANMNIKSLTIADTTNGMSLNSDGNTLTITPGASTSGIVMNAGVPASSIAAPVVLGADQTWTNNSANAFSVSSTVSGGFALAKAGSGQLILPVANGFSGGLALRAGEVLLGTATSAGIGTLTFDNGGLGSTSARYGSATALTVTNPVSVLTGSTASNSIVNDGSNNVTVNSAIDIATGTALTLANNNTGTSSLELGSSALATGGGSIVTSGTSTGNLVFRGANTYSGGTTLGGSSVHVPGSSSTGPAGSPTDGVFGTGTLTIGTISIRSTTLGDTTIGNTLILAGDLTAVNGGASEKTLTFSGPATLTGTRTITSNLSASGKSLTFSGAIGESASGLGLTKTGTGPLILSSAASTFTGPVVVSQGILQSNGAGTISNIGTPSSIGAGNATSNATNAASLVLDGGTYSVTNTNAPVTTDRLFTLTQNGGTLAADDGTAANVVMFTNTAAIAYTGSGARTLTLGGAHPGESNANLFAPQITDAGADVVSLQKTGSTTWTLTNTNTYTGATTITAGILQLGDGTSGNDGTIANTSGVANSGTLVFNRFGSSTAAYPITGTGGVTKLGAGTQTLSGLSAIAGNNYSGTTIIDNGTLAFTTTSPSLIGGLTFGSAAGSTNVGALDLSSTSATFGSLTAQTNSATANTITVGSGQTLQINGAVSVGATSGNVTTRLTATGLGNLSIGDISTPTNANMSIGIGTGDGTRNNSTLDLSGLATFYANLGTGTFRVGSPTNGTGGGTGTGSTVFLAENSTIQATAITVGSPDTATQSLRLGGGTNTLNANTITVGSSGRSNANLSFNGANGSVTVRGLAGEETSRANLTMANTSYGTATNITATFDTRDHDADLMFGTMTLAQRSGSSASGTGNATATLHFNQGTLNANDLTAGSVVSGTGGGNATGNLNLSGGTATFNSSTNPLRLGVNTDESRTATGNLNISGTATVSVAANNGVSILLGNATVAGGTATGALSLTGGSLTVAGDIIRGTATGTSNATLAINGASAILDIGGNDVTGLTSITYTDGTLKNLGIVNTGMTLGGSGSRVFDQGLGVSGEIQGDITGSGIGLTKQGAGTLVLSGPNSYSGNTTIDSGILSQTSANTSNETSTVTIAASGATLNLNFAGTDTVDKLFIGTTQMAAGVYGPSATNIAQITGTGTLTVTTGPAGGYDSWKTANAGGQGPELDFDNDGVDNGVEYFMNAAAGFTANPQLNGSNTITWPNGGNIPASAYGTQFVVQTSSNMVNWTDVPAVDPNLSNTNGSLTYTLTGTAPRFVRLVVTPN